MNEAKHTKHTPEERAALALTSADIFCNLTSAARSRKFPGYWEGSAFRRHPCGVIEGVIKLTNHWHVDNHCDVQITDGEGWNRSVCQDSFGHGDPYPSVLGTGSVLIVWRSGQWVDPEYQAALEPKLLDLLTRMARHIEAAEERQRVEEEEANAQRAAAHRALELAAIAKATGSRA
jgi:hypothetical protein